MLILNHIIELAACVSMYYMMLLFAATFMKPTLSLKSFQSLVFLTCYVLFSIFPVGFADNTIMSILCLVLQFVIFQFSFHGLFLIKAGVLLAYTALDLVVSILGLSIFQLTFHVTQETLFAPGTTIRIIYLIVTNSFECILLLIGYKFVHLRKQLTCHQFIIFFLFILNDAFSMFLCYLVLLSAETIYIKLICILITILFLLCTVIVLALLYQINEQAENIHAKQLLELQVNDQEKQLLASQKNEQKIREIRHDIKKYLNTYRTLLEGKCYEELHHELDTMLESRLSSDPIFYTPNLLLNSLLHHTGEQCRYNHIIFTHRVSVSENYHDIEAMILISNLLDNALEAEINEPEEHREILVNISEINYQLSIVIQNRITNSVLEVNPTLNTTKKDAARHGFGISSIRRLVQERGGYIKFSEDEGFFIAHILIPLNVEQ